MLSEGREQRRGLTAKLEGFDTRERTEMLLGKPILVEKTAFAPVLTGEYYWSELVGLDVINQQGVNLGRVDHLIETGANDVLVVRQERSLPDSEARPGERLLPWTEQVVVDVNRAEKTISVDWDADF